MICTSTSTANSQPSTGDPAQATRAHHPRRLGVGFPGTQRQPTGQRVNLTNEGQATAKPVPVLLITGPVGVGKSTIAAQAAWLLRQANVPHALVDLDAIEICWPIPADDPWNERLSHRNLACMWANFREAGAERLLLVRVLEDRSLLRHVAEAVPGADVTVVRLRARLAVLQTRRSREAGDPSWFLGAAAHTAEVFEQAHIEDYLIDNEDRPVTVVAAELLRQTGWLRPH
jgi:hypothetical protein